MNSENVPPVIVAPPVIKPMINFRLVVGKILSLRHSEKTNVQGGGGGGGMIKGYGFIVPTTVSTTHTTRVDFWIQTEEGREESFWFINMDIPIREGQTVAVLVGNDCIVALRNFSAEMWYRLTPSSAFYPKINDGRLRLLWVLGCVVLGAICSEIKLLVALLWVVVFVGLPVHLLILWSKQKGKEKIAYSQVEAEMSAQLDTLLRLPAPNVVPVPQVV